MIRTSRRDIIRGVTTLSGIVALGGQVRAADDVDLSVAIDGVPAADVPGPDRTVLLSETVTIGVDGDERTVTIESVDVDGTGTATDPTDAEFDIEFDEPGDTEVTVEIDANGEPIERSIDVAAVEEISGETFDHYTVEFGPDTTREHRIDASQLLEPRIERQYVEIAQRNDGLPTTVEVTIADLTGERPGFAYPPNRVEIDPTFGSTPWVTFTHELAHIAAYELNAATDGEWNFLFEGHAVYEEDTSATAAGLMPEKPEKQDLLQWEGTTQEYGDAENFVAALVAEYDRSTVIDLLRDSAGTDLRTEFERATGESFDAFYDRWLSGADDDPFRDWTTIVYKPHFYYQDGMLELPHSQDLDWMDEIAWDVTDDGNRDHTGEPVEWAPSETGAHAITLRFEYDDASIENTQTIRFEEDDVDESDGEDSSDDESDPEDDAPVVVGDDPATDTTGDGLLNDVNGDGEFDITDVQVFFENLESDAVQANADLFDFSDTGGDVSIVDVQALFERL